MNHIKELFKFGATLMGEGYNKALNYINKILPLEVIEIPSGKEVGTWIIPEAWQVKDGWVKFKGEKIIDYKKEPLSLMIYSQPFKGKVSEKTLEKHLFWSSSQPDASPYFCSFYKKNWGFCVPKSQIKKKTNVCTDCVPKVGDVGKVRIEGVDYSPQWESILKKGMYEVFIDTKFEKDFFKIGVHTIKGKSDREILLFAHLDHPYQANDNLSGVQCLMDLAKKIKCRHTIKLVFCPETIGSIAYTFTQDISKVDFVIAVDICGNDNTLQIQKSFDKFSKINYVAHLAVYEMGISHRKADFRLTIGSDEYPFNDPLIGIPGILLTRWPYPEYHTAKDTPDKIKFDKIEETEKVILKIIDIYEKDYIPARNFKGPLMRSRYDLQTPHKFTNRDLDYLIYDINGKKWLSEIVLPLGLTFSQAYAFLEKLKKANLVIEQIIV